MKKFFFLIVVIALSVLLATCKGSSHTIRKEYKTEMLSGGKAYLKDTMGAQYKILALRYYSPSGLPERDEIYEMGSESRVIEQYRDTVFIHTKDTVYFEKKMKEYEGGAVRYVSWVVWGGVALIVIFAAWRIARRVIIK